MKKSRRSRLSQSSRVSDKVMEYYMKYGKDRKLEKFMRFRSPGGSQKSTSSTTTTSSSSDDWAKIGNLECLFNEREISSEEHMAPISNDVPIASTSSDKEIFVPIEIETDDKSVHKDNRHTQFNESPKTPTCKNEKGTTTKQTQTPESVAKSHKRLEWDSLADVGYKKSKSTSNISIVERMLLREFIEVTTNAPKNTNSSESDIRLLEQEIADLGTLRKNFTKPKPEMDESNYGTPPLASSTHVGDIENLKFKQKDVPKVHTVGTNTSTLQQKFEKFAQTSLRKPEMTSQEVQVTLTSPGISPFLGSSAEPSSFEYRSRLSTNSSEAKSTQSSSKKSGRHKAGEMPSNSNQNNENLLQRISLNDNNTDAEMCERLKNLFISWNNMMEQNKENASSSSSCSNGSSTPQIDLGIQLICGIMKTKNIDQKQKKRLVRNIVKRITKIASSCELDAIVNKTATLIESNTESSTDVKQKANEKLSVPVSEPSTSKRSIEGQTMHSTQKKVTRRPMVCTTKPDVQQEKTVTYVEKPTTKSKKVDSISQNKTVQNCSTNITISTNEPQSSISTRNSTGVSQSSQGMTANTTKTINAQLKSKTNPQQKASTAIETKVSSSSSSNDLSGQHMQSLDISLCLSKTVSGGNLISAIITQPETKESNSTTKSNATTPTSSSSSSSKDLPTQKAEAVTVREHMPHAAATHKGAMQEWLNPLTQSEVEYEDKKRASKADRKENRQFNSARSGKYIELNWIDCEIERLQNLKHNLLKGRSTISTESDIRSQSREEHSASTQASEKLYDTVYSDQSKNENRAVSSPVVKEMPTRSDQKSTVSDKRTTRCSETKAQSAEQRKKDTQQQQFAPAQRSKMNTPSDTIGNESVGSFVRQRKQEFLDHYKSQKLNHYDQIMHKYNNDRPSTSKAAAAASQYLNDGGGHYSVPVPIQIQQPTSYYTYPPMQQFRDSCYYTKAVAPVETVANRASSDMPTKAPRTTSSELSVPMGSYNTNSTSTTTHQYDIATMTAAVVADKATIGSQTGRSLLHSRPIYETRCLSPYQICSVVPCSNYVACTCANIARTACVQARPKGIAYSLQFETKSSKNKPDDDIENSSTSSEEYRTLDKAAAPSLQVALKRGNPKFLAHAKKRKSILNRIQKLRQERERELREIADDNTSLNSLDRKLVHLPPPVTERVRLFPTKQMKAMTNRHVAKLPEVLANQERERELRSKRSNRLLREVYNRRLRDRVRGGKLNLNHSLTLI